MEIVFASNLFKEGKEKEFFSFIFQAYEITEHFTRDYPKRSRWYLEKMIPGIFKGTREIIACIINGKIAGLSFLKKINSEKKICTFIVLEEFRNKGIATSLMEVSFTFLGTTKPLITLPDYKLELFCPIIEKYDWKQTQVLSKGFYNEFCTELVFNGKLL